MEITCAINMFFRLTEKYSFVLQTSVSMSCLTIQYAQQVKIHKVDVSYVKKKSTVTTFYSKFNRLSSFIGSELKQFLVRITVQQTYVRKKMECSTDIFVVETLCWNSLQLYDFNHTYFSFADFSTNFLLSHVCTQV